MKHLPLTKLMQMTDHIGNVRSGNRAAKHILPFTTIQALALTMMLLSLMVFDAENLHAQPEYYAAYPTQDVRFHQADIEVSVNRNATRISGTVNYEISAFFSGTSLLQLHARNMTIGGILLEGEELEFESSGGMLTIDIHGRLEEGRRYNLQITYEASPDYGIHLNERGTVWTSNMPGTTSAWVPVLDTPFQSIPVSFAFTISGDLELMSVGEYIRSETAGEGLKTVHWKSDVPIAASDWNFAMGDLIFEETISGIKPVRLYTEPGTLSATQRNQILRRVSDALGRTQRALSMEFPFDGLNLLVLGDHRWEEKSFASGYGYLFINLGDLLVQADRNVLLQWFGARQRTYEGHSAALHQFFAAGIYSELRDEEGLLISSDYPATPHSDETYSFYGPEEWNSAMRMRETGSQGLLSGFLTSAFQLAARLPAGVYDWSTYNRFIYEQTGTTFSSLYIDLPDRSEAVPAYNIAIAENEREGTVTLSISPLHNVPDSTILISMNLIMPGDIETAELELSPAGGQITRAVDASLENITFDTDGLVDLTVEKPLKFWLHQLRRHEDADQRAEAALAMSGFTGDPDLQLALNDVIRNEDHPDVRAGLVRAMSAMTQGASGTEQMFMNFLREEPVEVRLAAIDALAAYTDNDEVKLMTGRTAQTATDMGLAVNAVTTHRLITSSSEFRDFARRLITSDRPPAVKAAALEELFLAVGLEEAAGLAADYLSGSQPYALREAAFNLIISNTSGSQRVQQINQHAGDSDPRMRYHALQAAKMHLDGSALFDLIEARDRVEEDYRIRNELM